MCAHDPSELKTYPNGKKRCMACHRVYCRMWMRRKRDPAFAGLVQFARMVWR